MKILNLGSLNIDRVYSVETIAKPGETISSFKYETFCGGKGLNQSIALQKAGCKVFHAGKIGFDGEMLLNQLISYGVNTDYVMKSDSPSGHAIIQVEKSGQNNIILFAGTNGEITTQDIDNILNNFEKGDMILLQNEVSNMDYIINCAYKKGMIIALNPSPITPQLLQCDLSKVSIFLMNEIEAARISGKENPSKAFEDMKTEFPNAKIVMTLGQDGVKYFDGHQDYSHGIFKVKAVDTTAAGDTFTGYFLHGYVNNLPPMEMLKIASKAAAISVSRHGAAGSVPTMEEVLTSSLSL